MAFRKACHDPQANAHNGGPNTWIKYVRSQAMVFAELDHKVIMLAPVLFEEEGTHKEFLAQNGLYQSLFQLQADNGEQI